MNIPVTATIPFAEIRDLEPPALEAQVLDRWQAQRIFERSVDARRGAPVFSFYEGPPTANGRPGIHHVLGRAIKDVFCRYRTLKGYRVERKAGWDTHGLPVEIEVEKTLGLEGHAQVLDYGIDRYNRACRDSVSRYQRDWDELTRRIGYWVDLEHPYVTCHNDYIESVWWLVRRLHELGLLYRGHKIQWYSPGSNTVLSSHEVSLGYREVNDPSLFLRFQDRVDPGLSYLVWTTTPWTLPSNVALAVHPEVEYVEVRLSSGADGERLLLAAARLEALQADYAVVRFLPGAALLNRCYQPLYRVDPSCTEANAWRIVGAKFVSTSDGTGIVHIAPAFGADDHEVGSAECLPLVNPVRPDGRFRDDVELVGGQWFKDADRTVLRDLRARGVTYREETNLHNYPHDWRKGTPLMSYPVDSWFVRTSALRDRLVALNKTINWYPPSIRDGRFGDWLENNVDWALSRKRFWGTPLPIWQSDAPGSNYFEVIGSIAELRERCGARIPAPEQLDLHRPFVDELTWPAPDGGTMRRVEDVMDVWFDSGAMPYAQWHYPFENNKRFQNSFPADFICEGLDQTRGWFYTLHAIATLVHDSVAYRNVIVNGIVLDENGEKMSKSRGNTIEPMALLDRHGADVLRWYMLSNAKPWENMRFAERGVLDTRRRFFDTLRNVYSFFASYANIDGFVYAEARIPYLARTELDRWILSRLNDCIEFVDQSLEHYEVTDAVRAMEQFVDDLSNWYIRRSRQRFWKNKKASADDGISDHDKIAAYQTTCECLEAVATLISPIAPFFADWLYRALHTATGRATLTSVHLGTMPEAASDERDLALERWMAQARTVVTLALLLRNQHRINVRRPLARLLVAAGGGIDAAVLDRVQDVIREEVNVQQIAFIDDSDTLIRRTVKPLFRRLGPRLGKRMAAVAAALKAWSAVDIAHFLQQGGAVLEIQDESIRIEPDDVEVISEQIGDWAVAQEGPITVALDTHVTAELLQQGLAREVVNRIQNMRKNLRLNLTDRIAVRYCASSGLDAAIAAHRDWIKGETLALLLDAATEPRGEVVDSFAIDEYALTVAISRVVAGG